MKKIGVFIYISMTIGFSLILAVFMLLNHNQSFYETQSQVPSLIKDGHINENISQDVEDYVSKNFGFRQEMLGLYTSLQNQLFHVSPISQVIVGQKGYLYYGETLDDYLGIKEMTEREEFQIVHTLELMQEYVESQEGKFLFVIAPNKNSLYDYMPSRYIKTNQQTIAKSLLLNLNHVHHVNLFEMFNAHEDELYYKTDSHWNNEGARLVYCQMMNELKQEHDDFSSYPKQTIEKMKGDLYNMLYPKAKQNEVMITYEKDKDYEYLTKTRNHEQAYIETYNEKRKGSLLMFRDSFANHLIDYLSDAYQYAIYDKNSSYQFNLMKQYHSDTVILEIAERNLKHIQESKPKFLAPQRKIEKESLLEKKIVSSFEMIEDDEFMIFEGIVDLDILKSESCLYVEADGIVYEMTPQQIDGKNGFYGCVPKKDYKDVKIYIENKNMIFQESLTDTLNSL